MEHQKSSPITGKPVTPGKHGKAVEPPKHHSSVQRRMVASDEEKKEKEAHAHAKAMREQAAHHDHT
jgi:hypothetical protein